MVVGEERTAAGGTAVDVDDVPVVLRARGENDGVRRGTAERMSRSKSSGASWNGDGVRLETTVTVARGSGDDAHDDWMHQKNRARGSADARGRGEKRGPRFGGSGSP